MTLKVACARWKQTPDDLRELALRAPHARTRERFLALYDITQGTNATQVAAATGRHFQSVMAWVHLYNARGPDALAYRRTGGDPPFAPASRRRSARPSPRSTTRRPRPRA